MSDVTITECFLISSESMKRKVRVDKKFTKEVDDRRFLHVATSLVYAPSLFANGHPSRALAFTDVFETIVNLRNDDFENYEESHRPPRLEIDGIDIPTPKRRNISSEVKVGYPKIVTIEAPAYGPIDGLSMTILSSWNKAAPLFIELTEDNLQYMMDVCKYQIEVGDKKRTGSASKPKSDIGIGGEIDEGDDASDVVHDAPDEVDDEVHGESPHEQTPCATISITTPVKTRVQRNLSKFFSPNSR